MKHLISFFVLSVLGCASAPVQPTPVEPAPVQPTPVQPAPAELGAFPLDQPWTADGRYTLPDGGSCVLTRPQINKQELTQDLMTPDSPGGVVIVKCAVLATGEINNCRTIKDDARMAHAVARRLQAMRAVPASKDGEPFAVDFVFNLLFKRPE